MNFVSNTLEDQKKMLQIIGVNDLKDFFKDIPENLRLQKLLDLNSSISEIELVKEFNQNFNHSQGMVSFLGAGAYQHYVPAIVDELASRSEFYTAYTPYQPEVSQGTLTAIFEFQTFISRLTGMDVTNASMYDGATSVAESVLMSTNITNRKKVLVSETLHPHYQEVIKTYAWAADLELEKIDYLQGETSLAELEKKVNEEISCLVVQSPNFFGIIEQIAKLSSLTKKYGIHFILVVTEPLSLALLSSPQDLGVDIVCGELQSFGNYLNFGGPMLGFISCLDQFKRRLPGRLVGQTLDSAGQEAYALTLQTREQHIRREKATSNICSNEGLLALRAAIYLSYYGNKLKDLALLNHKLACYTRDKFLSKGFQLYWEKPFFNEILVKVPDSQLFLSKLKKQGIIAGHYLGNYNPNLSEAILVCLTEEHSPEIIDSLFL